MAPADEIIGDISIYNDPSILLEKYQKLFAAQKTEKAVLNKYLILLLNIQYASQKIWKYEKYFQDFYPDPEIISKIEALNHHIHSYLEDMDILKEKINKLLGSLKNDIRKTAQNKKETDIFFKVAVEENFKIFEGFSKHRHPHHHDGMRFIDEDLLNAENAQNARALFLEKQFNEMIKPERLPEILERLTNKEQESFEIAKARWVETARNTSTQTLGYLADLLNIIKPSLYQFLNIKPVKEVCEPFEGTGMGTVQILDPNTN